MRILDPKSLGQHVDRLYRAAWALCGSREDAEDLVQETFVRVLARPRVLHGDEELYYLMRVLRNTFLTSRRTASRRPVTVATLEDVVAEDAKPMGRPDQALEVREVYEAIASLPEDFRMAIVAIDVLGLSYREAARALKVREATITSACSALASAWRPRCCPSLGAGDSAFDRAQPAQIAPREDSEPAASKPPARGAEARAARERIGPGGVIGRDTT